VGRSLPAGDGEAVIVLYNPLSTTPGKQPLPISLMSLAAVLDGREPFRLVDGNLEPDPAAAIAGIFEDAPRNGPNVLAVTVMPGPQLTQAVEVSKRVKATLPEVSIVWGGYFPTQHPETVMKADFVDFVVRSQGELPFLELLRVLQSGGSLSDVPSLSWRNGGGLHQNPLSPPAPLEAFPDLPYHLVAMEDYIHTDYLGARTVAYNSSFGCPFACNFCAVVAMSNRKWIAQPAERVERVLRCLARAYGIDAVQMHDMDFFVSESRAAELSDRIEDLGLHWWGLGRIDTLMHYSDETFRKMARSGLKMVFSGAESGSEEALARMNKGGTASPELAIELARRLRDHGIVPEYSFVLGTPPDPEEDIRRTFQFIRQVKRVNPATEIILYLYTPVADFDQGGTLYGEARSRGFAFPETLEEWASRNWRELSLRRGDRLPWIRPALRDRVRDFERVLNAFYPTTTDRKLTSFRRALLKSMSFLRYRFELYGGSVELRVLQRLLKYQRPETTGF
jgi:radical SAM superfamily enzyme YgiQ (UPF0313 family)